MSTVNQAVMADLTTRRAPGFGGFNLTALKLEIRRLLRNKRTVIISLILPIVFLLLFGSQRSYEAQRAGLGNEAADVLISIALYGAVSAATFGGAMVSIERAQGWSRQLRLTPLSPAAYIAMKVLTALTLGLASVVAVNIIAIITPKASMPGYIWIVSAVCVWIGSLLFAAFGLFMGYLLPQENVMQLMSLALTILAFAGGLLYPINQASSLIQTIAKFTPLYGLNGLVHAPLLDQGVQWIWVVNVIVWLAIFGAGAMWRFRKDTARV